MAALLVLCAVMACASACAVMACASASASVTKRSQRTTPAESMKQLPVTAGSDYLALGDSVSFGFQDGTSITPFEMDDIVGYPEVLATQLGLNLANASCPGETSANFIDTSAPDLGCQQYKANFPLHVKYTGSQLAYALHYLKTTRNVRLVSFEMGLVDLSLCQQHSSDGCASSAELAALDTKLTANVRTILSAIRNTAHYTGQLAVVDYYPTDYSSSLENVLTHNIDDVLDGAARPYDVKLVNSYAAFAAASSQDDEDPCVAGLIDPIGGGACGYHPTPAGQAVLAAALRGAITVGTPA